MRTPPCPGCSGVLLAVASRRGAGLRLGGTCARTRGPVSVRWVRRSERCVSGSARAGVRCVAGSAWWPVGARWVCRDERWRAAVGRRVPRCGVRLSAMWRRTVVRRGVRCSAAASWCAPECGLRRAGLVRTRIGSSPGCVVGERRNSGICVNRSTAQ
ncbi:predicted protein [Streptomyces sp. AA4]|nr:predicted protein [Streptomyces sp. AA4]